MLYGGVSRPSRHAYVLNWAPVAPHNNPASRKL